MMSLIRKGESLPLNLDWRVYFLGLGPEGQVTMGWEGCVGRRVLARYWVQGVGGGSKLGGVWILIEGVLGRIFGGCLGRFGGLNFEYVGV